MPYSSYDMLYYKITWLSLSVHNTLTQHLNADSWKQ